MKVSPMTALHSYNYLGEQTLCAIEQAMTKVLDIVANERAVRRLAKKW
jgi:hypothetical protein